ncbi:DUF2268 domain-containing protein [Sporosarcina siberiensis]|uniref:DUF2268 domain-containing protein n=1 Tax=Sporosarcina siberiensis TaxID=1365606 RepID=A0ABW4SJ09_9BACL
MPVIDTYLWLSKFSIAYDQQLTKSPYTLQCALLCAPIVNKFPDYNSEELQYEFLNYGLFNPSESEGLEKRVMKMKSRKFWEFINLEYQLLKNVWQGPEVSIYIFPITNLDFVGATPTKNGVAYKNALFLFLSENLSSEEIRALFAHEYNHICRLHFLAMEPNRMPLMDSLIIEGLAEYAVRDLYGERWLGPWNNLYSYEKALNIWLTVFIHSIHLKGLKNHRKFLYGEKKSPLPEWIGYSIGYQIVDTYQNNCGPFTTLELLQMSSEELIKGSDFPT